MGVLSDDEAKRIAAQLVHDIANAIDVDEAASIYSLFASGDGRDALAIGLEVIPQLLTAFAPATAPCRLSTSSPQPGSTTTSASSTKPTPQNRNGRRTMNAGMQQPCPRRHRKWQHS